MSIRVGKVTSVNSSTGKVKVYYEDAGNTSLELPVLSMCQDYALPNVGDRVVTAHMDNGSSKGFVLGTYKTGSSMLRTESSLSKRVSTLESKVNSLT